MKSFAELKALLLFRAARFIGERHESRWKQRLVRIALRVNLLRHGRDPLAFLQTEDSIDHMDYEAEDELNHLGNVTQVQKTDASAAYTRHQP
ncbi:hypothetical protein [Marinobacter sp. AL4B]|uniref:hypothetical protein n=1 Tax=Marinobacter sp. AL4B TaxID=2871173 RepID=UPI001CAA4455|nr:hypothetical protein [Marinobacter sp. AL4B]MBZ0334001.1 hypothetical protein [Marinobacter sp. AL4B]